MLKSHFIKHLTTNVTTFPLRLGFEIFTFVVFFAAFVAISPDSTITTHLPLPVCNITGLGCAGRKICAIQSQEGYIDDVIVLKNAGSLLFSFVSDFFILFNVASLLQKLFHDSFVCHNFITIFVIKITTKKTLFAA